MIERVQCPSCSAPYGLKPHRVRREHRRAMCFKCGGVFPIDILGELVSIGTLLAFVLVCVGVMVLRATKPEAKRPFVTPLSPLVPLLGVAFCGAMMYGLPGDTWIRLAVWFILGLVIFATYSIRHAKAKLDI